MDATKLSLLEAIALAKVDAMEARVRDEIVFDRIMQGFIDLRIEDNEVHMLAEHYKHDMGVWRAYEDFMKEGEV